MNVLGFGLADDEWHPYVAGLSELLSGYPVSPSLTTYYGQFQPKTLAEAFGVRLAGQRDGLHLVPAHGFLAARLFVLRVDRSMPMHLGHVVGTPSQHFGPARADNLGMAKAHAVFDSIRERGYRPLEYEQGAVRGFFIADQDRMRFVVTDGNHRLAAFHLLGLECILAEFDPAMPSLIHADDLQRLARPRRALPLEHLRHVHRHLIEAQGTAIAREFGLGSSPPIG